jgi:hypothetical protein
MGEWGNTKEWGVYAVPENEACVGRNGHVFPEETEDLLPKNSFSSLYLTAPSQASEQSGDCG